MSVAKAVAVPGNCCSQPGEAIGLDASNLAHPNETPQIDLEPPMISHNNIPSRTRHEK